MDSVSNRGGYKGTGQAGFLSKGCTCATELWNVLFAQRIQEKCQQIVIEVAIEGGIEQGQGRAVQGAAEGSEG